MQAKPQKPRFTYKEKKEYETIESDIEALELQLHDLEAAMAENARDYGKLAELQREKDVTEEALSEKMERWEYLSELAERLPAIKNHEEDKAMENCYL